jgi:hypothetical protein
MFYIFCECEYQKLDTLRVYPPCLYFYFSGLSLKRTSERPSSCFIKEIRFLYIAGFKNTTIEIRKEEEGYQLILLYAK